MPTARPTRGARIWATRSPVTAPGTKAGRRSCSRAAPTTARWGRPWGSISRATRHWPWTRTWGSGSPPGTGPAGAQRPRRPGDEGFREITYRINGGFNGWNDRLEKYNRAKAVLGVDKRRSRKIKCNFVAVGEKDSRVAHQAAAILNKRGIRATVTVDDGVRVLGDVFADEPLGKRQMIVVGRPALDALTAEVRKFVLYPANLSKTDYVSAVGKS